MPSLLLAKTVFEFRGLLQCLILKTCLIGTKNEGSFDPWSLLSAMKRKALNLGVHYIKSAVTSFKQAGNDDKLEILKVHDSI